MAMVSHAGKTDAEAVEDKVELDAMESSPVLAPFWTTIFTFLDRESSSETVARTAARNAWFTSIDVYKGFAKKKYVI